MGDREKNDIIEKFYNFTNELENEIEKKKKKIKTKMLVFPKINNFEYLKKLYINISYCEKEHKDFRKYALNFDKEKLIDLLITEKLKIYRITFNQINIIEETVNLNKIIFYIRIVSKTKRIP